MVQQSLSESQSVSRLSLGRFLLRGVIVAGILHFSASRRDETGCGEGEAARRLAEKFGKDQNVWDGNVEEYILRLSERKYFDDDVVRYGYCRGEEPFQYVRNILARYEEYRKFLN